MGGLVLREVIAINPRFRGMGSLLLVSLPIAGIMGMVVPYLIGMPNLTMLSIYLAIPMIVAPLAYMAYRKSSSITRAMKNDPFRPLLILFVVLYIISLILLYTGELRPYAYYLAVAAMATVIMLEIMLTGLTAQKTAAILGQVAMLTLNVLWGINLKYYYYVGRTDTIGHAWYIQNLLNTGFTSAGLDDYQWFPLWHMLQSTLYTIGGLDIPVFKLMFISNGLIYLAIPLGIFLVVKKVTGNDRMSLLSALFVSFYPYFIVLGTQSLSRGITTCLGIYLVLLLLDRRESKKRGIMALFLTAAIIIYHPVAIMFTLLILFMIYVIQKIFVKDSECAFLNLRYFVVSGAMVVVYWSMFAQRIINAILVNINSPAPSGVITKSIVLTPMNELVNYLQYMPLLFFIIAGALFIMRAREYNDVAKAFMLLALILIPLSFPGPMFLFNKLAENFNMERFYENGFIYMSMGAAAGFAILFSRAGRPMKSAFTVLFALLVLLAVSNDFTASDNPLVKRPFFTYYFDESETVALDRLSSISVGFPMSDYVASRYIYFSPEREKFHLIQAYPENMTFLRSGPDDLIIVRSSELEKRPLDIQSSEVPEFRYFGNAEMPLEYYYKDSTLWKGLDGYDMIYDSETVRAYR